MSKISFEDFVKLAKETGPTIRFPDADTRCFTKEDYESVYTDRDNYIRINKDIKNILKPALIYDDFIDTHIIHIK